VGFSLGGDIKGEDEIKWDWGDGSGNTDGKDKNPHHEYKKAGKYLGEVSVGKISRKFGMLVLPDRLKHIVGKIEVADATESNGVFPAKTELNLQVQLTGGTPEYHIVWRFGDGNGGAGIQIGHIYNEKGNYQISCTVRDQNALTFYFEKNITIV